MKVDFEDAEVLRETLSNIAAVVPPAVATNINFALKHYAERIRGYCSHPKTVTHGDVYVCVMCGHIEK